MVATHSKKIKYSMLCVTGVYLRDVTNTIFVILHLNLRDVTNTIFVILHLNVSSKHLLFMWLVVWWLVYGTGIEEYWMCDSFWGDPPCGWQDVKIQVLTNFSLSGDWGGGGGVDGGLRIVMTGIQVQGAPLHAHWMLF